MYWCIVECTTPVAFWLPPCKISYSLLQRLAQENTTKDVLVEDQLGPPLDLLTVDQEIELHKWTKCRSYINDQGKNHRHIKHISTSMVGFYNTYLFSPIKYFHFILFTPPPPPPHHHPPHPHWIEKQIGTFRHLESCSGTVFKSGPIVCKLCVGRNRNRNKQTRNLEDPWRLNFMTFLWFLRCRLTNL